MVDLAAIPDECYGLEDLEKIENSANRLVNHHVLAIFDDYNGQWSAIRARVEALGITRLEFDHLTGLQEGYSGKLLGAAQRRRFGKESLGATLGGIGCKLVLIEDPEATAKIMARAQKRKLPFPKLKLLPPPRPPADEAARIETDQPWRGPLL